MGYHLPDYQLTGDWVNIGSLPEYADIAAGKTITIQAKFVNKVYVFVGGALAPEGDNGGLLRSETAITSTNENWWVKGDGSGPFFGKISVFVEDS